MYCPELAWVPLDKKANKEMTVADKQAIKAQKRHLKLFKKYYKKALKLAHKQINKAVKCGKEVITIYLSDDALNNIDTTIIVEILGAIKETLIGEGYYVRKHTPLAFTCEIRVSWGSQVELQQQIDEKLEQEAKKEQMKQVVKENKIKKEK